MYAFILYGNSMIKYIKTFNVNVDAFYSSFPSINTCDTCLSDFVIFYSFISKGEKFEENKCTEGAYIIKI